MIKVIGPKTKSKKDSINTTSSSTNWSKGLSPFFLGPIKLYNGRVSLNLENAYQFCKVYGNMVNENESPDSRYWAWAEQGWASTWAHRYPMGKGIIPLYSLWAGERLDYLTSRRLIYLPLYRDSVKTTKAYAQLEAIYNEKGTITLFDFDGYEVEINSIEQIKKVLNNPEKKMGHAFVLAAMLLLGKEFDLKQLD